jgi:hypothetical protein
MSYVAGPIAGLAMFLSLALMAFGVGSGRGWALSIYLPITLASLLGFELLGGLLGSIIGLIRSGRRQDVVQPIPPPKEVETRTSSEPAEADLRPSPGPFWPWLVGALMLLTLITAFGAGFYLGRSVDRHLAEGTAAADLDDPSWRVDDLMAAREPVPIEENSAPLVTRAHAMLPQFWPDPPIPLEGQPEPPDTLGEAFERLDSTPGNVRLEDTWAETLRRELEKQAEPVRIARTVADFNRGRYEVVLGATLIDTPMRHLFNARVVARLLAADVAIRVHDGDLNGAIDSCRTIFGVGQSIGDEPFLVSQLVRIKIGQIGLASAQRILAQGQPSDPALARLQALVLDELGQPFLLQGVRGERAMVTEIIRRITDSEMPIASLSGAKPYKPGDTREQFGGWTKLVMDHQLALELDWMNKMVAIARCPLLEQPPLIDAWQTEVDRVKQSRFSDKTATLPLLFAPAVTASASHDFRYRCQLGSFAILLAAERHRLKTGDWPNSIAAIDPSLLPVAPVDPFTGQTFRMERRDGQLFIYSVGPNGKDEHGAVAPGQLAKEGPDDYGTGAWDVALRRQMPAPGIENPARSPELP